MRPFLFVLWLAQQLWQLGDVRSDPPRLVAGEQNAHKVGLVSLMSGNPLPFQLPPRSSSRAKQPG